MLKRLYSLGFAAVVCSLLFLSCSKDSSTNPSNNNNTFVDTTYANITWTSNTVKFKSTDVVSSDSTYENIAFNSSNKSAQNLQVGNIIFIEGKALRKVSAVNNTGTEIDVSTEDCTLNEAISDGEFGWDKKLMFTPDLIGGIEIGSKYPTTKEVTGNSVEFSFPIGNGMTGKIKMTLNNERVDATCEITRKIGIAEVKYSFDGFCQKMTTHGKIKYTGQQLKEFSYNTNNIEGEITVALTATGSSDDLLGGIDLPFTLLKVPIVIGGIPIFFNIKMLFVINTKMASIDASAYMKTKFTFNSQTGVSYNGTDVGIIAGAGPYKYDFIKDSNWVASSVAAGINFGLTFPRFELQIFGNTIVPYAHTAFLIGGSFTTGTKPCLTCDASFIGAVGYKFDFLGLLKFGGSKTLWNLSKNIKKSGDC